jgi:hypothetical protein
MALLKLPEKSLFFKIVVAKKWPPYKTFYLFLVVYGGL